MTIFDVKDYTVSRVYWDIKKDPNAYPTNWIKNEGIPYWEWVKRGNPEAGVSGNPEAQLIIDLYYSLILSRELN